MPIVKYMDRGRRKLKPPLLVPVERLRHLPSRSAPTPSTNETTSNFESLTQTLPSTLLQMFRMQLPGSRVRISESEELKLQGQNSG